MFKMSARAIAALMCGAVLSSTACSNASSSNAPSEAEPNHSAALDECIKASGSADFAMTECYYAELDVQDAKLNQTYNMVMQRLTPQRIIALRNGERTWIKQRDAVCEAHAQPEAGGTLYDVMLSSCMVNETIKRTTVLEKYQQ